jgi:NitT/TauT family transport system substrate-binding protein
MYRRTLVKSLAFLPMMLHAVPARAQLAASPGPLSATMAVGGRSITGYLPVNIADALGYFKDEGLALRIDDFTGGELATEALVGGSDDLETGSYSHVLDLQVKGIDLLTVVTLGSSSGIVIALSKNLAAKYRSPKDLAGLKFGVTNLGSLTSLGLSQVLAKGGLQLKDVTQIAVGSGASAVAAMKAGLIEGLACSDPAITLLTRDGDITPIVDARTEGGTRYLFGGNLLPGSILTTKAYAQSHPQVVQALVNAIVRALKWMHRSSIDQIVAAVPTKYIGPDRDLYRLELKGAMQLSSPDGRISGAAAKNTLRLALLTGEIKGGQNIDVAATYTNAFVERANQRYK